MNTTASQNEERSGPAKNGISVGIWVRKKRNFSSPYTKKRGYKISWAGILHVTFELHSGRKAGH